MSWFHKSAKDAGASKPAKDKSNLTFARAVGDGYISDEGKWFPAQDEAERDTALRHLKSRIVDTDIKMYTGIMLGEQYVSRDQMLAEPDVVRAMAILGRVAP